MKNDAAKKATERGRSDCRKGITRNPYLCIGGKHQHLASWWDKGYSEENTKRSSTQSAIDREVMG